MTRFYLFLALFIALAATTVWAQTGVTVRKGEVPVKSPYVPLSLDDVANDHQDAAFLSSLIEVDGIPFNLVSKAGANNLFLKSAEWTDWKNDPTDYYSAYDSPPKKEDHHRFFFQVPVADYSYVYLLAAADNDTGLTPSLSFRIGIFDGMWRTTIHDFSAVVPRQSESSGTNVLKILHNQTGNLFLMRIPLGKAIAQDFKDRLALDVDITKELRLAIHRPDPCRFSYRPLGLPSGVHLFGVTFCRSALQMEVTSHAVGHIFNEPEVPTFKIKVYGVDLPAVQNQSCVIEGVMTHYDGTVTKTESIPLIFNPWVPSVVRSLPLNVSKRGYYELKINVKVSSKILLTRETHFALLAPDQRKYRKDAPWGTWDFSGSHFTPDDPEVVGPLYVKAGLRYGMFGYTDNDRERYGILRGNDPAVSDPKQLAEIIKLHQANPKAPISPRYMIFHENCISGTHITRTPDVFTGRPPYRLDEAEEKQFETMRKNAEECCRLIRKEFPKAEIYFGNGAPHLLEEFLRSKFPRELFDARGNEGGNFMRLPEAQPTDFIANNAGLWMDRQILDHYGYNDVPLRQCYEICYPSTNPGNLTLHTQAAYYVRHILHSMAWQIPIIRPSVITDVGNSYYFSNWGASGLCFAKPDVSPKPAYVAIAVMTQVLDGATFSRVIPTTSSTVYALEFRKRDKSYVTSLWTTRGKKPVNLKFSDGKKVRLTGFMGDEQNLPDKKGKALIELSSDPVYVLSSRPITEIVPGSAQLEGRPQTKSFLISSMDSTEDWVVESEDNEELEIYDFDCPRRKGNFSYLELPAFEGESKVLQVKPKVPVSGSVYLPMYSVLKHVKGIGIPGQPTEIGLIVNGNGGWGRILFELEDASGQRWISIGCEQSGTPTKWMADWMPADQYKNLKTMNLCDWNTNDPWGRSVINFEGWRYLIFPLPGNYPGEGYHWPYSSQWRYSGDGRVIYPLTFKKLIITIPEKVLHVKDYAPVARQEIYLKDLMVTYDPPEEAFKAE